MFWFCSLPRFTVNLIESRCPNIHLTALEHPPDGATMFQPCCNDAEIMLHVRQQILISV